MRRIFHIDLDAFFVSVERVLDPSLHGRPVIVGGEPGARGVVACASYEARPYGVKAGMPLAQARRLCPQAVFLRGRFEHYGEVSRRFMELLGNYTPFLQPLGLDEAFLDMTGFESLYGPMPAVAAGIRGRIRKELQITASVGIAGCKVAAKVASELCKPDGLLEVPPGGDAAFLAPLPAIKVPGIGEKTAQALERLGVSTVGQLAATSPAVLRASFGAWADLLHRWANGQDLGEVAPLTSPKSIGRSTTFARDTLDTAFLKGTLRYLAELVGAELRQEAMVARSVVLTLRLADFTTLSRHVTLSRHTDTDDAIYASGLRLLARELEQEARGAGRQVRLLGIGVTNLTAAAPQLTLFGEERSRRLARAVDAIRSKYGYTAIQTARCFVTAPHTAFRMPKPMSRRLPRPDAPPAAVPLATLGPGKA